MSERMSDNRLAEYVAAAEAVPENMQGAMERLVFALRFERKENQRLKDQIKPRCDHCGCDKIYSGPPDCPRCGAPVCCEICCKEQALKDRIKELEKRLEIEPHGHDGIYCRDETIKLLSEENQRLKITIKRICREAGYNVSDWLQEKDDG